MTEEKKFDIAGGVSIITTGKKTVKKDLFDQIADTVNQALPGQSMGDIYDRFSKLIYLVDTSGSMGQGIDSGDSAELDWTQDWLDRCKQELVDQLDDGELIINPDSGVDLTVSEANKLSVEMLKQIYIDSMIAMDLQVPEKKIVKYISHLNPSYLSKMQSLKKAARDFVSKKFKKNPDSRVLVYSFEMTPRLLSNGASEDDVIKAINSLEPSGGTNIFSAVRGAVNDCGKMRSDIGANHIVLVSDGCDDGAIQVQNLLDEMREQRVVFDFIFMKGRDDHFTESNPIIVSLIKVCEMTGGQFTIVETAKDFETKFLQASSRKCLPPGPK